jgi:hypothetical protein
MRFPAGFVVGMLLLTDTEASHAAFRIANDRSGLIGLSQPVRCALISMMVRSSCSNQRPNTLTQAL